jgi:hypothetical protein
VSRKKQTRGKCVYCGREMAKGGMLKHLDVCEQRQQVIAKADQKTGVDQPIFHLRTQDSWGDFWLDLEMPDSTTLKDLDRYLRAIWLECCGHLSRFSIGGWGGEEIPMKTRIDQIFNRAEELIHIYDFGTSSTTHVKRIRMREGKPTTPHPIALMARNSLPEAECMECDQPAKWLCMECLYEEEESGYLCNRHVRNRAG